MSRRRLPWLILLTALVFVCGCAKSDWIQQTLVTVDVTGVWVGYMGKTGGIAPKTEFRLELEQQGSKANGYLRPLQTSGAGGVPFIAGPVEGTVCGDVFTFRQPGGTLTGELTVSGDEMKGYVTSAGGPSPMVLQRIKSSVPPRSQ
jgi:hypothetical protein